MNKPLHVPPPGLRTRRSATAQRSGSSKSITLRLIAGPEQPGGVGLTDLDSTEVFV